VTSGPRGGEAAAARRREALAGLCVAGWLLGALAARWVGTWPGIGGAAVVLGCVVAAACRSEVAGWLRPTLRGLLLGVAAGALQLGVVYALFPALATAAPGVRHLAAGVYRLFASGGLLGVIALPLVLVAEELVWRGLVQGVLTRRIREPGWAATAVVYAAAHAPAAGLLLPALALPCGLYWGLLRRLAGGLFPPLVCHLVFDTAVLLLFPLVRAAP